MALISALPLVKNENYQLFIFVRTKAQVFRVFLNEIVKIANSRKYGYLTAVPLILKADLCIKRKEIPQFYRGVCGKIRCPHLEKTLSIPEEDFPAIVEQVPITAHGDSIEVETYIEAFKEFGCPYYVIKRCLPYANIIVTTQTYLRSRNLQDMFSQILCNSSFTKKFAIIDEGHNFGADIEAELQLSDLIRSRSVIPLKVLDRLEELIVTRTGRVERPKNLSVASIDAFIDHDSKVSIQDKINLWKIKDFILSKGDIWVSEQDKLIQINPFPHQTFDFINQYFNRIILMSGTFIPMSSYLALYSINYPTLQIPSDFQFSLNGILYNRTFTSRFKERTENTYKSMANVIERLHKTNPFHTIVFATSHEFKQKILYHMSLPNVYVENPGIRPYFIDELKERTHECIFGVMGGSLAEGIEILDLNKRSLLTLIIIAGLPFPQPDATNLILTKLYSARWGVRMAKHLGKLPVTRNISQSIGRGIRSESDFAASLILDYRAMKLRQFLPKTRIFRDINSLYNAYDLFYAKMKRIFRL